MEAVARTEFAVDGARATEFLTDWIAALRLRPSLQAVVLGGRTIAGLGLVDLEGLARALCVPVISVTRTSPSHERLEQALYAAGLPERVPLLATASEAARMEPGLYVCCAGVERHDAFELIRRSRSKSKLPEALRVAHLIAAALVRGQSHGRA